MTPMWPLLHHATCTLQNATRATFVSAGLLDVSSLEVQRPRLLDFASRQDCIACPCPHVSAARVRKSRRLPLALSMGRYERGNPKKQTDYFDSLIGR